MASLEPPLALLALLLALSLAFGLLTWVSRNVWQDRARTQLFALLGVASTLTFVALVMVMP